MAGSTPTKTALNSAVGNDKVHERVHLLSRVMDAAEGRRIVLIVDEVGFDHRLVIESAGEPGVGPSEQCEANR
jgi:hypothetical protein